MAEKNYRDEFTKKYEKPILNDLVVGFSGIDPQNKSSYNATELTDEQLDIVNNEIDKKLQEIKIKIDSGNVDPDNPYPEPTPTPEPITPTRTNNHEELEGLQGGQDGEHYHLTQAEREKVSSYPEYSTLANNLKHEKLEGLLGGNANGHYHLTDAERTRLLKYPDYENLSENIKHEELDGLLGGNSSGHYHLTEAERNRVRNYPDYSELKADINHEEIDGLLGGNDNGHYHLTEAEKEKLQSYPKYSELSVNMASNIDHEKLTNLQGGDTNGHYHLTESEKQKLSLYPSYSNLNGVINHEKISGLQGGAANEHYHLTEAELSKIQAYPEYSELEISSAHNELTGLQGGQNGEYYHLTLAERTKLQSMSAGGNHEELSGLLGGEAAGHFHLTGSQLTNVQKLIALFFPDGATQPVIPEGITLYDPFGDLPSGTPPGWQIRSLPSGYAVHPYVDKMYAGYWPEQGYGNGLCVPLKKTTETDTVIKYFMYTPDLDTWKENTQTFGTVKIGTVTRLGLQPYLYSDYDCIDGNDGIRALILAYPQNGNSTFYVLQQNTSNLSTIPTTLKVREAYTTSDSGITRNYTWDVSTFCYSPLLNKLLIFAIFDHSAKKSSSAAYTTVGQHTSVFTKPLAESVITTAGLYGDIDLIINPGCAAWSDTQQVFCCSGLSYSKKVKKTATSSDGINWTEHTDIPDNLIDLTYREDLSCFIARGQDTKLFYASGDGETWQPVNQTPIPLETVAAVDYNPENEWYCAVGGTGKYAYFSKDLEHWIPTTISNSDVTAGSVIYMPSTGLYVLMPTSGSYYYTFNPANWTE